MARQPRKGSSMGVLYPAICQAVREIKDAEKENLKNGIHRLQGKTDDESIRVRSECYDLRARKLFKLRKLLDMALPAGIKAGFSGEHVVARLKRLARSAERAVYWNEQCLDDEGWYVFADLFDRVEIGLEHLAIWALATAADPIGKDPKPSRDSGHSRGFRTVKWFGTDYSFTANQAVVVKLLWEAWENGTPDVGQEDLRTEADIESQLRHLFRDHPAWNRMIGPGKTKGTIRLHPPNAK
jgi:hypothetical protein